jgi:HK97 family phage portal protein
MRKPTWFGRVLLKAIGMEDESFWATWSPLGNRQASGDTAMSKVVGDGLSLDVIMSPVLWVARRMAESDLGVRVPDDETIDLEHPIAKLMRRPNPWYAGSTMRMALAVDYLMQGNAYMRKIRGGLGGVAALQYLPSWSIEPLVESDAYQYRPGGVGAKTEIIPSTEIVHLRYGMDPAYSRKGLSPIKILLRELYTDVQGSTMTAMLLKNAGLMGVVISPKEGVTIQKPGETKKYIQDEFTGVRMGNAMVMTAPTQIDYFGADAAKMDLSALREIPEERVCALLGIPSAVVGFGTGMQSTKVGATLVELRAMAYEDCIIPIQNSWCDEIDIQLLPDMEADPESCSTQFDNSKVRVLQPDDNAISTRILAQLAGGAIMLSEAREELGYETTPDEEVYYIPGTITVTDPKELIAPPPPPPVIAPPGMNPPGVPPTGGSKDGKPTEAQGAKV